MITYVLENLESPLLPPEHYDAILNILLLHLLLVTLYFELWLTTMGGFGFLLFFKNICLAASGLCCDTRDALLLHGLSSCSKWA